MLSNAHLLPGLLLNSLLRWDTKCRQPFLCHSICPSVYWHISELYLNDWHCSQILRNRWMQRQMLRLSVLLPLSLNGLQIGKIALPIQNHRSWKVFCKIKNLIRQSKSHITFRVFVCNSPDICCRHFTTFTQMICQHSTKRHNYSHN